MKKVLFTLSLIAALLVPWVTQAQELSTYTLQVDNVTYSSIRTTGTQLTFDDGDDAAAIVNMPFSFWFGEDKHVDSLAPVSVTTNGYILLDTTGITTYRITTSDAWLNIINPIINYNGDMGMNANAGAYYKVVNDNHGSPESLIIEYYNLAWHFNDESYLDENNPNYGHFSYQIVLHRNGNIEIIYDQVDLGDIPVDEEDGDIRVFLRSGLYDDMLQLTGAWANPTIATDPADLMDNDVLPVSGLRYTFQRPATPQCARISHLAVTYYGASVIATWRTHRALSPYTGIQLTISGVDGSNPVTYTTSADWSEQGTYLIPNLQPGTQYLLTAKALCEGAEGEETSITFTPSCPFTIGDNGATSVNYLPMNTCYNYALTQQLYRASEIGSAPSINSLALFFYSNIELSRNINIYLANTSDTALSTYLPITSFTQVYSGSYTFRHGWNAIPIQSFARNANDNLVFMVQDNNGSYLCTYYFAGHAVTNPSLYQYTDSAPYDLTAMGSGAAYNFRNDIIFYVDNCNTNDCAAPMAMLRHVDSTHAIIDVAPGGGETGWVWTYRPDGSELWSEPQPVPTDEHLIYIDSLVAGGMTYHVRVGSQCDDTILWYELSFATQCGVLRDLPYYYGFEDARGTSATSLFNSCIYVNRGLNTAPYAYPNNSYHATGNYSLYFSASPTTPSPYITLPPVADEVDLSKTFLSFNLYKTSSTYGTVSVGVMTDPTDITTFVPVGAFQPSAVSTWQNFEVPLNSYRDSGRYVAIVCNPNGTSYNYAYIDDIELSFMPVCPAVKNVEVTPYTKTAVATWELRPSVESPNAGSVIVTNIETGDEVTYSLNAAQINSGLIMFDSLDPVSRYSVRMQMRCEDEDGTWTAPIDFRTTCLANYNPFGTSAVEGGNVSAQTNYLPTYHFYRYSYTQSLYLDSELTDLPVVTKIAYNFVAQNVTSSRDLTVYVGETDSTNLSMGFLNFDGAHFTRVFSGTVDFTTGWNDIPFSVNYQRTPGKNFVIAVLDNTGNYLSSYAYAATNTPTAMSVYVYTDGSPYIPANMTGGNILNQRADIRIYGDCDYTLCGAPTAVMVDNTKTSATFHIGANDNSETFAVQYYGGTNRNWVTADAANISSTNTEYTLEGLASGTAYVVRFGAVCDTDTFWFETPFATECDIFPIPYSEDFQVHIFDNPARQLPCWTFSGLGANSSAYTSVVSESMMLNVPQATYVALPELAVPVSQLRLRFRYVATTTDSVAVGLMTDPRNMTTFTEVARFATRDAGMAENFFVDFSNVDAEGEFIAFYSVGGVAYLDNVEVDYPPSCTDPTNLQLVSTGTTSVKLSWTANGTPQNWLVEYGPVGFTPGNGTCVTATTNTNFTLSNLDNSTCYDVYVYNQCTPTDTSLPTNPLTVQTDCAPISTLPYTQNFENMRRNVFSAYTNRLPECWSYDMIVANSVATNLPQVYVGTAHSTQKSLRAYYNAVVAMPELSLNMSDVAVRFWSNNSTMGTSVVVGVVDSITPGFAASFVPVDTVYSPTSGYKQYTVYMTAYQGTGKYIAFRNLNYNYPTYNYSYMYIDDVELIQAPDCLPVRDIFVRQMSNQDIVLSWTEWAAGASQYEIEYGPAGFAHGNGTVVTSMADTVYLSGLTSATDYDVYVRSVCGTNNSEWTKQSFTTDCDPVQTLPFYEGFDSLAVNTRPDCWRFGMDVIANGNSYYPRVAKTYPVTAPSSMYMYYRTVLALPTFETPLDSLMVTFNSTMSSTSYGLIVGFVKHNGTGMEETFVPIDTVRAVASGQPMSNLFYLNLYPENAEAHNFAFRNFYDSPTYNYPYSYVYLDDVTVDRIPDCVAPYRVHVEDFASNSVTIDWTDVRPALSYEIEYGAPGFEQGTGTVVAADAHPFTINRLASLSRYDVYVRGLCTETTYSDWSDVITVGTDVCVVPTYVATHDTTDTTQVLTTTNYVPGYSYYNYSYTQTLFDSTDLSALANPINGFDFHALTSTGGTHFHNCEIYLGHTDKEQFTGGDWVLIDSAALAQGQFVKVFTGDLTYTEGWNLFGFDTTFTWDGHSNVVMAIKRDNGTYVSGSQFQAVQDPTGKYRTLYVFNDGSAYDPATVSGGTRANYRFETHLYACGPDCIAPVISNSETTYESLTLSWLNDGNAVEAAIMPVGGSDWSETVTTTESTYTFTGLQPATDYWVRVRQLCDAEIDLMSEWEEHNFTTDSLPCFAPTELHATEVGFSTATVAWTLGTTETQWNVHVWNTANDWTFTATDNPYTITGLTPGLTYNVAVSALCGNNGELESDFSDTISITTTVCDTVSNVAVTVDGTTATVTWTAGANNSGHWKVNYGYLGFSVGEGDMEHTTTTSVTLSNLTEEQEYDVYVAAVCDGNLESVWSSVVHFTTGAGSSTGIAEATNAMEVNIYPNPARQSTTIRISGAEGSADIKIVDVTGRTVYTETVDCGADCVKSVDVNNLAQGTYFVSITSNGVNAVKKLIVK